MKSKVADRIFSKTPTELKIFANKYSDLVVLISQILKEKGYNQKKLAENLDKRPSEITKWLGGEHNFTLRSICKLEAELGETLLEVKVKKHVPVFSIAPTSTKCKLTTQAPIPFECKTNIWVSGFKEVVLIDNPEKEVYGG